MLYSILIYGLEAPPGEPTPQKAAELAEMLARHAALRKDLLSRQRLGPVARLMPRHGTLVTHSANAAPLVITDGPFAETKEQLMGLYIVDFDTHDEVIAATRQLHFDSGRFEIRPLVFFEPGVLPAHIPA